MGDKPLIKPSGILAIAIGSGIAIAVAGLGIFSYSILRPDSTPSAASPSVSASAASDNQNAVTALGRLQAGFDGPIKVAAPSTFGNTRIVKLMVQEGVKVRAGQPLAVMDSFNSLLASAQQAEAQVIEAQSRLAQVQAGAKQGDVNAQRAGLLKANAELPKAEAELLKADAELKKAEWEYGRYQNLFKDGAIAELELRNRRLTVETRSKEKEQAQQALEQARFSFEQSKQELSSVSEIRPTDINQAKAQVQVAMSNLQKAKAEFDNAIVRAPVDGQVLKIHTEQGETVDKDGILELGKTDQMFAVAEVDENDIGRVQLGKKARITGDAFRGEEITGTVVDVGRQIGKKQVLNTDPVDKVDTRIVEVRIRLDDSKKVASLTNLQVKVAIDP